MRVVNTENADLIAHDRGDPLWKLIWLLPFAGVMLWFPFVMNEKNFKEGTPCLKLACLVFNPIFKAMPILLWKIILLGFGVLAVFVFINGLKTRSKKPLVFVMDAIGIHNYRHSLPVQHLAWAEICIVSHWGDNLRLKPEVVDCADQMIDITITNWDVSKDQIIDVVRKYRPDLQLVFHYDFFQRR